MKRAKTPNSTIIFDLDGTLADSITVVIDIVNEMKIIESDVTRGDYERVKNLPIKTILKEFNISVWRAPALVVKGRTALTKRINEVPFFSGMEQVIEQLAKDHRLFVMSSNSLENVRKFLKLHGIDRHFEQVYGGVGIFGKAKMLRKVIKDHNIAAADTYYVGDETRDIEAAKKAKLHSVAVTWGFNGEKILKSHKPEHLVHTPEELQQVFGAKR